LARPPVYPPTRTVPHVDHYHGVAVADPYRWLEDDNAAETIAWAQAQNQVTEAFLAKVPARAAIKARLTRLWNYERYGLPSRHGGIYLFARNDGLQNQAVLYAATGLDDPTPRVLLDPNRLSDDGTVALGFISVSDDGATMAYGLSVAGSDWSEIRVREVATGVDRPDLIKWVKWSGAAWAPDGRGFYYARYDAPAPGAELQGQNYYQKLYFHRLGTEQAADVLVYRRDDEKEWTFSPIVSEDGRYLVIHVGKGTDHKNAVFCRELGTDDGPIVELVAGFGAEMSFLGNVGATFYFKTDRGAPRGRVVKIALAKPTEPIEVIAEAEETLVSAELVGGALVLSYLQHAHTVVRVHELDGRKRRDVVLPGIGTAVGFGGKQRDVETFYSYTSFTAPAAIYRYDIASGESRLWRAPRVEIDASRYRVEQAFYHSKDGTRVPMFIVHRADVVPGAGHPTLLYGYGGFAIPMVPAFSAALTVWLDLGGVYAVPNLRGGNEYGEPWHQAGTKLHKQNVFDDFIAAAKWLIENRWTTPKQLAISGGSNGGLLVGACMTQRPELFGAALPAVGVLDMLRFHKFTIGWAWIDDYGSSDDPAEFRALYAYSPYHRLVPGTHYPATLVTTADHDDRVVPAHSFKFAARLQACQSGDAPVLIRIDVRAGHGAGKPTSKLIDSQTDVYAFLVEVLGMEVTLS
jgi:prolyl oligopeptidase